MVSQAYSSIRLKELCLMLGLKEEGTLTGLYSYTVLYSHYKSLVVTDKGWKYDESSQILHPMLTPLDLHKVEDSQERLARLVDIVSFLEN